MKIFEVTSSNRKQMQIVLRICAIVLLPLVSISLANFIWAFVFYLFYFTVAHSIMLHRYYGHSSFEFKNKYLRWFFVLITVTSVRGAPIGWAYLHKLHHAAVDTEDDPHSPHYKKYNIFKIGDYESQMKEIHLSKVKRLLTKENVFIGRYYWLICLLIPVTMLSIDLNFFYFAWLLPVILFDIFSTFFNYANHKSLPGSYINFINQRVGYSVNNWLLWFLSLGEAWHNNHHNNPTSVTLKEKWWEFDPSAVIINLVRK
jgi:stearoyl-CoA desaturase (Delta-9 desaturase)